MSFSSDTKEELCGALPGSLSAAQAEAYGILMFCNSFGTTGIRISTQSGALAKRLPPLFEQAFGVAFDEQPDRLEGAGKLIFRITRRTSLEGILEAYGYSTTGPFSLHINYAVLEDNECIAAFCKGAFLAGGSVTDPAKRYHLEMATNHLFAHREFQALLPELHMHPRATTRKSNYLTYFKKSDDIAAFLTAIGAPKAAQAVMSAKVEKDLVNGVNRQYNCDVANVDKAVAAAQTQIDAIRTLRQRGELDQLPEKLRQTAQLREEYPELSLAELAAMCVPAVSKSCLNHRLRKLQEMAASVSD